MNTQCVSLWTFYGQHDEHCIQRRSGLFHLKRSRRCTQQRPMTLELRQGPCEIDYAVYRCFRVGHLEVESMQSLFISIASSHSEVRDAQSCLPSRSRPHLTKILAPFAVRRIFPNSSITKSSFDSVSEVILHVFR